MSEEPPKSESAHLEANASRQRLMAVAERIATFRREIKPELTQAVNDFLRTRKPQSAEEKKEIANQIRDLLESLGLAIDHNGKCCNLYALSGPHEPRGRFRIQALGSNKPSAQSANLVSLLPLTLTDAHSPRHQSQGWSQE